MDIKETKAFLGKELEAFLKYGLFIIDENGERQPNHIIDAHEGAINQFVHNIIEHLNSKPIEVEEKLIRSVKNDKR